MNKKYFAKYKNQKNNTQIYLYVLLFLILLGCLLAPNIISLTTPYFLLTIISLSVIGLFYFKKQKRNFFKLKNNWIDPKIAFIYICAALPLYYSTIIYYLQSHYLNFFKASFLSISEIILFIASIINPFFIPFPFLINSYIFKAINLLDKFPLTDKLLSIAFIVTTYILWLIDYFYLSEKLRNKFTRISIWIYSYSFTVACSYFAPALGKLFLGNWVFNNSIDEIYLEHAWKNGFDLFEGKTDFVASILRRLSPLLCFTALFSEFLPIVTLNKPRLFLYSLLFSSFLHIAIFIFSGILFWKWVVINLSLLIVMILFIKRKQLNYQKHIFFKNYYFNSYIGSLIGSSAVICIYFLGRSSLFPFLAWYDPQNSWMYEFKIKNSKGVELKLPNKVFSPYSLQFGQHRWRDVFFNVSKERIKNIPRGANPKFTPKGELILSVDVKEEDLIREWKDLGKFTIGEININDVNPNFIHVFVSVPNRLCNSIKMKNDYFPVFNHIWSGNYYTKEELKSFCKNINSPITFKVNFIEELRLYNPKRNLTRKTNIFEFKYLLSEDNLVFSK